MKKILLYIFAVSTIALAQRFSHPLAVGGKSNTATAVDTLRVLAILVQFQADADDRTSGDGRFDLGTSDTPIIDAPPHDSAYFADHFIFARNYFAKASNNQLHIAATVLGRVLTLSKRMQDYVAGNTTLGLAQMTEEAWKKADTAYAGFPFHQYDAFVVFHAGVGKDIDLRGALGYDPTPYDIPSLYFGLNGFRNVFGSSFNGIPVANNSFAITNTIILPETEVRSIPSIGDDIVLKLSINGLLVASIGSHLGLPDLFDTRTGKTAIGRFGLMDGQSMFSFSGICPPEPSAWEKSFLGWTTPIELVGNKSAAVPAVGLHHTGSDTVYKIPIAGKEYFLVENRQRDANENGQSVTMRWKGQTIVKSFAKDEESYNYAAIDSIYGVVLDVDELDWSLPGLINDQNSYRGGMVVWHIDESVIDKNLATNSVNANPDHRGVDVEEADGSQDIGQSYDLLSPGSGSEDGSPLDYWFDGNIAPVYTNEFSETSRPNSLSNQFAKSLVTLRTFSASAPRMSFTAITGSSSIALAKVVDRMNLTADNNDAPFAVDLNGDGLEEILFTSGDSIFVLKNDLTPFLNNATGLFSPTGGQYQPAFYRSSIAGNSFSRGIVGVSDSSVLLFEPIDANADGRADLFRTYNVGDRITTPVYARDRSPQGEFTVGTASGTIAVIDTAVTATKVFSSPIVAVGYSFSATADSVRILGTSLRCAAPVNSVVAVNSQIAVLSPSMLSVYDRNTQTKIRDIVLKAHATTTLSVHDVNQDNNADFLVGAGTEVYAFNGNGSVVENFPFRLPSDDLVQGSIVTAGDHLLFGTRNGLLYAITGKGKVVNGFPLQAGPMVSAPFVSGKFILAASTDTTVQIWTHNNLFAAGGKRWETFLGSTAHENSVLYTDPASPRSQELLPKSLAYNWPNPVYGNKTAIRYFLGKSASVKITIINMAGELVDELRGSGDVGLDNEVQWDVTRVQSGIYYAQITASGSAGEQSQIIKIAVVK